MRFWMFCVLGLFCLSCTRKTQEQPIPLVRLELHDATPASLRPVAIDQAKAQLNCERMFAQAGFQKSSPNESQNKEQWRASAQVQLVYGFTKGEGLEERVTPELEAQALLMLEMRLIPPQQSEATYVLEQTSIRAPIDELPGAALERCVADAFASMVPLLKARRQLLQSDLSGLVAALSAEESAMRSAAAERLGMLQAKAAVPQMCERLHQEQDRAVLLRLVGALSEMGDARAATALIALADPKDRELLRAILDALSMIGGERVTDFFDLLENHDSPEVREMLASARARLERNGLKIE